MKETINRVKEMNEMELHHLKKIIDVRLQILDGEKELEMLSSKPKINLKQGKKQPIMVTDSEGVLYKEFTGFTKCSLFIRNELGLKNEHNRLRRALETGEPLAGYHFELRERE